MAENLHIHVTLMNILAHLGGGGPGGGGEGGGDGNEGGADGGGGDGGGGEGGGLFCKHGYFCEIQCLRWPLPGQR